jgi:radical SAM superfamily enzyme YgiQ (UPF0313 family)
MKVLLVSPNVETLPDPVFPIGLAYITASLKKNQIPCQVLDLCFVSDYDAALASAVNAFTPDIIGLSIRNIDNVSYPKTVSYLEFYRQIVKTLRKYCQALIVIGGSGFALRPEAILNYLNADYGIIGEGEFAFVKFINALERKIDPRVISISRIVNYSPKILENLDALPMPDRTEFDNAAYLKWGGMGNIQTKRGCPFKCIYCTYPVIEGRTIRQRSPNHVCDEIENILEFGIQQLFIVDNIFNYPLDHAKAVCREIIHRKLPIQWSCFANPGFVTPELIELMLEAGCTGLEFGSDAANETMLINMGKNFTVNDLANASDVCRQFGISFCHSVLLGGPGETMETVNQTLGAILDMSPTAAICMIGIRVFPKTKLSLIAEEEGMIDLKKGFLKPIFYISPAIKEEILPFVNEFSKKHPSWIFPGLNININVELQKKLRRFGIKGPLWEHMKIGKKFTPHFS